MNEIIPGLFLGNKNDAKSAYFSTTLPKKTILCMHEELPNNTPGQLWFPLGKRGFDPDDMDIYGINFEELQKACKVMDEYLLPEEGERVRPVLVHCFRWCGTQRINGGLLVDHARFLPFNRPGV